MPTHFKTSHTFVPCYPFRYFLAGDLMVLNFIQLQFLFCRTQQRTVAWLSVLSSSTRKTTPLTALICSCSSFLSPKMFDAVYNDWVVVWPCNLLPCFGGDRCSSASDISTSISSLASELPSPLLPRRQFDCGPSSVFLVGSSTSRFSVSNVINTVFLYSSGRAEKPHSWQAANTAMKCLQGYWDLFQDSQIQLGVENWTRCFGLELEVLFNWNSPFMKFTGDTSPSWYSPA